MSSVHLLRQTLRTSSPRPFIARGANTKRCDRCLIALEHCICEAITEQTSPLQFVLLYHISEIFKPTNSGRLIADTFPNQTQAFLWHRTTPCDGFQQFLTQHAHEAVILYPLTEARSSSQCYVEPATQLLGINKRFVIVLDASWRQASKMLHQSRYLDSIPSYGIHPNSQRTFLARNAKHDHQLATAEVVAMLLHEQQAEAPSLTLQHAYQAFNQASLATRGRRHISAAITEPQ